MMKKLTMRMTLKKLEQHRKAIAAERDKLRDLQSDIEQLADDADEALDSLSYAIDALSRLQ